MTTPDPGTKAAIDALTARSPWTLSRSELLEAVYARLDAAGVAPAIDQESKVDDLLEALIIRGLARYRLDPVLPEQVGSLPGWTRRPGSWPNLCARMTTGTSSTSGTRGVFLPPVDRHLVPLLDGTRDRDALVDELMKLSFAAM